MKKLISRYLIVLTLVIAGGWLYSVAAVPLIEGSVKRAKDVSFQPVLDRVARDDRFDLESLLPENAWEFGSCIRLDTAQAQLLFKDYKELEDGRLEVEPLTMIFQTNPDDVDSPPTLMRTLQGAVLGFSEPITFGQSSGGKLERAWFKGRVTIQRRSQADRDDRIEIVASNVTIEEQRVRAPSEVEFAFGPHTGRGRNLTLELLPHRDPQKRQSAIAPYGDLGSLELVNLDEMRLVPKEELSNLLDVDSGHSPTGNATAVRSPQEWIQIGCQGPFRFDFQIMEATFRDQVWVDRSLAGSARQDRLRCDLLKAHFGSKASVAGDDPPELSARYEAEPNTAVARMKDLELEKLLAYGSPAVFEIPNHDGYAEADEMVYEPKQERLQLSSSEQIVLLHNDYEFKGPSIEYTFAENGRLGNASGKGPGRIFRRPSHDRAALEVTWRDELLIRPHDGLKAISLYGQPHLQLGGFNSFDAEEIHFWVDEIEQPSFESASPSRDSKWRLVPTKLLALSREAVDTTAARAALPRRGVSFESERLTADTDRLEVFFTTTLTSELNSTTPSHGTVTVNNDERAGDETGATTTLNNSSLVQLDASDGQIPRSDDQRRQKLSSSARLTRLRLTPDGKDYHVDELTLGGQVHVIEVITESPTDKPLEIHAEVVQAMSRGANFFHLIIQGALEQDASLSARGLSMFGRQINIDQLTNQVWIDGPGHSTIDRPSANLESLNHATPDLAAARNQFAKPTSASWRERMQFDGMTIRLSGDVQGEGVEWTAGGERIDWESSSGTLEIVLDQRVALAEPADGEALPEVKLAVLSFDRNVILDSDSYDKMGRLNARETLTVPNLRVNMQTGVLSSVGAGNLTSVRYGSSGALERPSRQVDNRGNEADDRLTFLDIEFVSGIVGNIEQREVHFVRDVDALVGPVDHWEQHLERGTSFHEPGKEQGRMLCDRLVVTQWGESPDGRPMVEIRGLGNAFIAGRGFEASGAKVVFNQLNNLLILEGDQNAYARLKHRIQGNGTGDYAEAAKLMYWRDQDRFEADGAHMINATYSGSLFPNRRSDQR